jgi:hypothetical protein
MNDAPRPSNDELARHLRSALASRAADVEIGPDEVHARVVTARGAATSRPILRSTLVPALTALAALVLVSALIVLAVGNSSFPSPSAIPSVPAAPSPSSASPPASTPSARPSPSPISLGRDPTGIPESLDGQPVTIGLAAVVHAQATTDATPFLIGGWFTDGSGNVCGGGVGGDPSPLLNGCGTVIGGDGPWNANTFPGPQGRMYWDGHQLPNGLGPSIVKVHTHDPRSADCLPETQAQCLAIVVVDDVLWTGDDWTNAAPISAAQAVQRLGQLQIAESVPQPGNGTLGVGRYLFATPPATTCTSPWPHDVFELHGDPRFGLVAIFADEAQRVATQAKLDASAPGCAADPRVVRPGPATWVGSANVLVLTYGPEVGPGTRIVLAADPGAEIPVVPFPPATLDESYRVVDDAEAARLSGNIGTDPVTDYSASDWFNAYTQDTYRRYAADALSYTIGEGRPPTSADMDAFQWAQLESRAVPGTARLYPVDHPQSTDPALAYEVLVAFEEKDPGLDSWGLIDVDPPGTTRTGDAGVAFETALTYEAARAVGKWPIAWPLLSPWSQASIGSEAAFEATETAYNNQGGSEFVVDLPTQDSASIANFLGATSATIAEDAQMDRGFLVLVEHSNVKAASAATTGLFVAPLRSGEWRVWVVH